MAPSCPLHKVDIIPTCSVLGLRGAAQSRGRGLSAQASGSQVLASHPASRPSHEHRWNPVTTASWQGWPCHPSEARHGAGGAPGLPERLSGEELGRRAGRSSLRARQPREGESEKTDGPQRRKGQVRGQVREALGPGQSSPGRGGGDLVGAVCRAGLAQSRPAGPGGTAPAGHWCGSCDARRAG